MTQSSLGDFVASTDDTADTPGGKDDEDGTQQRGHSRLQVAMRLAPDDAEPFADDSCPWCLAPADRFDRSDGSVECMNCTSRIPIDATWYQRGEKICV